MTHATNAIARLSTPRLALQTTRGGGLRRPPGLTDGGGQGVGELAPAVR